MDRSFIEYDHKKLFKIEFKQKKCSKSINNIQTDMAQ